mmetsp:Transcript_96765/g.235216  ORF Transcript_96765/g.235216 Transcript_96765/m.235216 type:complete len:213 (+) Transcript_96765:740-1378(+)
MSLRLPSPTWAMMDPSGAYTGRTYEWSGRFCAPPTYIFGVRSMAGMSPRLGILSSPPRRGTLGGCCTTEEPGMAGSRLPGEATPNLDGSFSASVSLGALMAFIHAGLAYSKRPSRPPSRPKPLSLYPPKPAAASKALWMFTHTTPARTLSAVSSASPMDSVHTPALRPYRVLLASAMASLGERNDCATSTGPKISSCTSRDVDCAPVISVGG